MSASERIASGLITGLAGLAALVSLIWWFSYKPTVELYAYVPGLDGGPSPAEAQGAAISETIRIGEGFESYLVLTDELVDGFSGSWPRFRGPASNNISTDGIPIPTPWGEGQPKALWSVDVGEGHAGPVIHKGRVYLLDYDDERRADTLRCFALLDGRELWRRWYRVRVKRNHGRSRTVPAVTDRYVVTVGPRCQVMCVDARTGELKWGIDLVREQGAEVPLWYTGQCPLIDDGVAVIAVGGRSLLIGVDCETGEVLWETPNPKGWKMSHSSIMPMELGGQRLYVYFALGGVVAVAASGPGQGDVIWNTAAWHPNVVAPSPVILEDGRIFLSVGYGGGSMMLRITEEAGRFSVETLFKKTPKEGLACEQQTPLLYRGHLFGIPPKDGGALRNQFVCYHPDGRTVWSSGKTKRFGLGPFLIADEKILILSDEGVLTVIKASTDSYQELASAKVLEGRDAWGPMALADGRLLVRDSRQLVCLDLRSQ